MCVFVHTLFSVCILDLLRSVVLGVLRANREDVIDLLHEDIESGVPDEQPVTRPPAGNPVGQSADIVEMESYV